MGGGWTVVRASRKAGIGEVWGRDCVVGVLLSVDKFSVFVWVGASARMSSRRSEGLGWSLVSAAVSAML